MQTSMRISKLIAGTRARARVAAALLAVAPLLACADGFAQSGRRQPKQPPVAPVPTPTPEPTPPPKEEKAGEKITLTVLADDESHYQRATNEMAAVQAVVVARLRESRALEVSGEQRRESRGEAVRRAKGSKGRHFVWLELRPEMGYETVTRRPAVFVLLYYVFEPGTGKLLTSGTVHLQDARRGTLGRIGLPSCYPNSTYEFEFVFGALEAAERIMKSFSLPLPPRCR